jgi:hypothetical protein
VASVFTVRNRKWRLLLLLPTIYAALHFSYGFGFLFGLVKFGSRWFTGSHQSAPRVLEQVSANRSEIH